MRISGHETRSVFEQHKIVSERDLHQAARNLETYVAVKTNPIIPGHTLGTPQGIQRIFREVDQPSCCSDLAGTQGFEPRYADPESAVLPLDDVPVDLYFSRGVEGESSAACVVH